MKSVSDKLLYFRKQQDVSLGELSRLTNIPKTTLQRYETGTTKKIPLDAIPIIEKALHLDKGTLMGWNKEDTDNQTINPLPNENIFMIPAYESVAAGFGAFPQDYIKEYIPTHINCPSEQELYMWINVTGDSMYPTIEDGSSILVKKQTSVDSGQIAVVLIDNEEAVVKRVLYGADWIELQSINPQYPPRRFKGPDVKRIKVLGLVKKVSKDLQ